MYLVAELVAELGTAVPKMEPLTFSSCGAGCGVCVSFSAIYNFTERPYRWTIMKHV